MSEMRNVSRLYLTKEILWMICTSRGRTVTRKLILFSKINNVYPERKWSEMESVCNLMPAGFQAKNPWAQMERDRMEENWLKCYYDQVNTILYLFCETIVFRATAIQKSLQGLKSLLWDKDLSFIQVRRCKKNILPQWHYFHYSDCDHECLLAYNCKMRYCVSMTECDVCHSSRPWAVL